MVLGNLIGGFITVLIGVTLMPEVADGVSDSLISGNVTGAAATVVGLVTLFFALGIMSAGVAIAVNGLKQAGMI